MRGLKILLQLAVAALVASAAGVAQAADCGASGTTGLVSLGTYDPFATGGSTTVTGISLPITRVNPATGKTNDIAFYFTTNVAGIHINNVTGTDVISGGGDPVIGPAEVAPTPAIGNSPPANTINIHFGGEPAVNDTKTMTFNLVIDATTDLAASPTIQLNMVGICKGTGGLGNSADFSIANAVTLQVTVLSALQAFYSGAALDYGEVGTLTDATVLGAPVTYQRSGNINVRSSGPYTIALHSGQSYQMRYGAPTTDPDTLDYQVLFLGQTRGDGAGTSDITRSCLRATLAGVNLPLVATLREGGQGNTPSPTYLDNLTVTITPFTSLGGAVACP